MRLPLEAATDLPPAPEDAPAPRLALPRQFPGRTMGKRPCDQFPSLADIRRITGGTEDAYRQVKARLELSVNDLGPTQLKNIAEPDRVYSLEVGVPALAKPRPDVPSVVSPLRTLPPAAVSRGIDPTLRVSPRNHRALLSSSPFRLLSVLSQCADPRAPQCARSSQQCGRWSRIGRSYRGRIRHRGAFRILEN
jgi:hypothetical protein